MNQILYQPWGGLGDNLQFSTLPELYYNIGDEFYISKLNVYRNDEIKKLVWDLNPFVKDFKFGDQTIGSNKPTNIYKDCWIKKIEVAHGFETDNKYPKIYYKSKNIDDLKDKTILSLNSISAEYNEKYVLDIVNSIITNNDNVLILIFNLHHKVINYKAEHYIVDDIFHHCDIINSCKRYICLHSGSSVLSAAINKNNTEIILSKNLIDLVIKDKLFYFDNQKYIY